MKGNIIRAFFVTGALAAVCAGSGCVADRPSRNGVFNENQYVRKDFLIRPGSGGVDPGWFAKSSVVSASTPNPLAGSQAGLNLSAEGQSYVNFTVTADRLAMNNMIMVSGDQTPTGSINAQGSRNQETVDSWPITNVDLKYRVNLDGEKTNFYEENQELDWQLRQWVKVSFDKNDQSDFVMFGDLTNEFLAKCTDTGSISATLHPGSFYVDEPNDYWQFAVDISVPLTFNSLPSTSVSNDGTSTTSSTSYDTYCSNQFGYQGWLFQRLGRSQVTFTVMYSFARATEDPSTSWDGGPILANGKPQTSYMPLVIPEHDNIQHKYGFWYVNNPTQDLNTGLWGSRQLVIRHDPNAPSITYYFAAGFHQDLKSLWANPDKAGCTTGCVYSGGGGGIVDQTNALLKLAGGKAKLVVKDYDADLADGQQPRQFGDLRYSFLRWVSDLDSGNPFLGSTPPYPDPRSGQLISSQVNFNDFGWRDRLLARLDFYESQLGAFNFGAAGSCITGNAGEKICVPATCQDGDTLPLVPTEVQANHNGTSTLFAKMQQYLGRPVSTWGNLGPSDFIVPHNQPFFDALNTLLPYQVFADPDTNQYVIPEGGSANYGSASMQVQAGMAEAQFQDLMSKINRGWAPFDPEQDLAVGGAQSSAYLAQLQQLTLAHRDYLYISKFAHKYQSEEDLSMVNLPGVLAREARHCINTGSGYHWETRDEYTNNLVRGYYASIMWHEFGHSMGLQHNFMGSLNRANFPHYQDAQGRDHVGVNSASIMDYNLDFDHTFWAGASGNGGSKAKPGWLPYDQAAISFIYANGSKDFNSYDSGDANGEVGASLSGQSGNSLSSGKPVTQANARWKDPLGWCPSSGMNASTGNACTASAEITYLRCGDTNIKYTPFCRQFDIGTTPSEITANEIDGYEWEYLWRNFPQYHQYYSFGGYANGPAQFFTEGRRFLSSWAYDLGQGELSDNFRRLGVKPPAGVPAATYYDDLSNQFNQDVSMAGQLYAAASQGIIQQSSGQRPFITKTDSFFGDTVQQGIAIDKNLSLQAFTALWQVDNYDLDQAAGAYLAPFSFGDPSYAAVAEAACLSMVGGQYNMFLYAIPLGVQQFAQATHSAYFQEYATGGRPEMKDWVGGYTFTRIEDFLNFFRQLAVKYNTVNPSGTPLCGTTGGKPNDTVASCTYDPTIAATGEDPVGHYHSDPFQMFVGPDYRRWIWVYLQDMNTWIVADRDRNVATFVQMYNYTADVVFGQDDGNTGPAYAIELPLKYFLNYYKTAGN